MNRVARKWRRVDTYGNDPLANLAHLAYQDAANTGIDHISQVPPIQIL
jgi:hypothetical protein